MPSSLVFLEKSGWAIVWNVQYLLQGQEADGWSWKFAVPGESRGGALLEEAGH